MEIMLILYMIVAILAGVGSLAINYMLMKTAIRKGIFGALVEYSEYKNQESEYEVTDTNYGGNHHDYYKNSNIKNNDDDIDGLI